MNFDVFTTAAMVAELNNTLDNGKIQDSLEIGNDAIGFEIYAGHRYYLLCSAHPEEARVQIVSDRVRRGVEQPSPLGLMLRRYVEGGRLIRATQPPWERVIYLEFTNADGAFTLIAEPMERRSNLLLVQDGIVMDCLRRVGPHENRVRVSLPGQPYVPPPPQLTKQPPIDLTLEKIDALLKGDPDKVAWRILTDKFLGFSPMMAKEALYRATADIRMKASQVDPTDLLEALNSLLLPLLAGEYTPGITEADGQITSYSAYEVNFLRGWHEVPTMSEALSAFYGAPVGEEAYDQGKKPVQAVLDEALDKTQRRLEALHRAERDVTERERLRMSGELLLAYQYQITSGQELFSAEYDYDQPPLEIKLDPKMTPVENALHYFEQYEKAKRATAEVPALIRATQTELDYLKQLEADLVMAANFPEIGEVQDALQAGGFWRGPKSARPGGGKSGPLKVVTNDGMLIWVGRNSRQNEEVTFGKGKPEDTWLHIRGLPGSHVIVKNSGRPVPPEILQKAAALAAYYSTARGEGKALVDVTERRYVRKVKGGSPGMVTYRNETVMEIVPDKE